MNILVLAIFATVACGTTTTVERDSAPEAAAGDPTIVEIAAGNPDFSTLVAAATAAGLLDTLSDPNADLTVFAPTDAAFATFFEESGLTPDALLADKAALTKVLMYHVVPGRVSAADVMGLTKAGSAGGQNLFVHVRGGSDVFINNAQVIKADIAASNGIVHVIDRVLVPGTGDIVDIASENQDFSTLVALVSNAGLVETLQGEGPFTVFAPTNAAFEAIMDVPQGEALASVLTYHALGKARFSRTLLDGEALATVNGASAEISFADGATIAGAKIVVTDIVATNGVIHVIDAVIIP
jgi:uncharacterized surface protein with fasciclin (FAS1) repeats